MTTTTQKHLIDRMSEIEAELDEVESRMWGLTPGTQQYQDREVAIEALKAEYGRLQTALDNASEE